MSAPAERLNARRRLRDALSSSKSHKLKSMDSLLGSEMTLNASLASLPSTSTLETKQGHIERLERITKSSNWGLKIQELALFHSKSPIKDKSDQISLYKGDEYELRRGRRGRRTVSSRETMLSLSSEECSLDGYRRASIAVSAPSLISVESDRHSLLRFKKGIAVEKSVKKRRRARSVETKRVTERIDVNSLKRCKTWPHRSLKKNEKISDLSPLQDRTRKQSSVPDHSNKRNVSRVYQIIQNFDSRMQEMVMESQPRGSITMRTPVKRENVTNQQVSGVKWIGRRRVYVA